MIDNHVLNEIGGYFEDGSATQFHLWPDDATRTWHVTRDGKTLGYGKTIVDVLFDAAEQIGEDDA